MRCCLLIFADQLLLLANLCRPIALVSESLIVADHLAFVLASLCGYMLIFADQFAELSDLNFCSNCCESLRIQADRSGSFSIYFSESLQTRADLSRSICGGASVHSRLLLH